MNKELTDDELLNYLITSDFIESFSPEEYKFLLVKFRYFYRLQNGRLERNKYDAEGLENDIKAAKEKYDALDKYYKVELSDLKYKVALFRNKKLTIWERITGKIDYTDIDKTQK